MKTYDPQRRVDGDVARGARATSSTRRASFWLMVPAGKITEDDVPDAARRSLEHGRHDRRRRQLELPRLAAPLRRARRSKGIHFVDAGVSGGVWGLEDGYCLMVGGDDDARRAARAGLPRPRADRTATRTSAPSGAGHFAKMVHNGIEYGLMQAYAEGFEIMQASEFDLDLHEIAGIWRYGSVVRSLAARAAARARSSRRAATSRRSAATSRTRARAAGRSPRRSTRTCPVPVITRRAVRALRLAPGRVVRGEGERRAAQPVRRPRGRRPRDDETAVTAAEQNPLARGAAAARGTPDPCVARHLRRLRRPDRDAS